ncbi:methyltransferase domain-containing protein [Lipingzhangella sp. LS1_29]|uniref:Protein-L-isoaspartate O-methyltransferase n=1 Tax=Lipingzhangella rawalii TaxID=2055835 RepID=A0ABU2H849_9ACTN|nr:methyltransferase domain-containing protein [Lipingzhangella rawalii]MDS1271486.1 methyltransferase domain-containing protein [Lipingzhangella rawalii]
MVEPEQNPLEEFAPNAEWAAALRAAPREWFVPDVAWTVEDGLIDRHADPQTWQAAVARDDAIVTQIDDGHTALTSESPWRTPSWTSSCSAPNMVFDFLRLLDPYSGDRVLEVGTGTGWTAALLSAYLGAQQVTSIEVDEQVAAQAKKHLDGAGFAPRLLVGDGAIGDPDGAPFDRVHATCSVRTIPYAWVEQTRPGGVIVAPWIPHRSGGYKLRLTVTGAAAVGRLYGAAAFMPLRGHRIGFPAVGRDREELLCKVDPRRIARAGPGLDLALTALLPGVVVQDVRGTGEADRVSAWDPESGSWALAVHGNPHGGSVGPRDLWRELERAYLTWVGWGEPPADRFGLTVDAVGQHVWLDSPDNQITEVAR